MDKNLQGYDELVKQIEAIAKADYTAALAKGVTEAILPTMQSLTPVDTGELLGSEGVEVNVDTVSLVAKAPHAAFVELGTVHQAAQPYMQPALDTRKDEALRITAREVENIMQRAI